MKNYYVVIMAGGVGSRFWPYSRNKFPKQFLDILGTGTSLLRMTYERFLNICPNENIFIVTNGDYETLVQEQLPELSNDQILLEPYRRNTAPCIAYASYKIRSKNPDATIVVAPSDHAIFKETIFKEQINASLLEASKSEKLITLGIKPSRPDTGYGYIQYEHDQDRFKKVKNFTEKPDSETAEKFLESGEYVWNAGIFIWHVSTIVNSLQKYMPTIAALFEKGMQVYYTEGEDLFIDETYNECESISIDYGIMEKSPDVYVELGDFQWSDLGSWASLHDMRAKDKEGNVVDGNALVYDSKNCIVMGPKEQLIVVEGLENYLITHCDNVILICNKDNEERIRTFVADAKKDKGEKYI